MTPTHEELTGKDIEVRLATTDAEREAVYRSRYSIYVEEMGRYGAIADHDRRLLTDPEDARSWIVYAAVADEVIASFRITWGGVGFSDRQIEQYQLAPFLAEIPAERMSVGERTMIAPAWRGHDVFTLLGDVATELSTAHDIRLVFGACEPHLISFYGVHQRPYGTRNINSPDTGLLIPLLSFNDSPDDLLEYGTYGELPRCVHEVLHGTSTVLSPLFVGEVAYQDHVIAAVDALVGSVFDGLSVEQIWHAIRRSNVVTGNAGDRLIKCGGAARSLFVVLDGSLAVSRHGSPVGTVVPGEIVGETAFLLHGPRTCDVDVVEDGTRVLSLSERTIAGLTDASPTAAAKLMVNISRQLCRRPASLAG